VNLSSVRSVEVGELGAVYRWALEFPHRFAWRFPERIPPLEQFVDALQPPGVLVQTALDRPISTMCSCYGFSARSRYASIAVSWALECSPDAPGELLSLTVDRLFAQFDLRKVYVRVAAVDEAVLSAHLLKAVCEVELIDELRVGGDYVGERVFALWGHP